MDYTVNDKQTLFGRYIYARYNSPVTTDPADFLTANQVAQKNIVQALTLGHTYVVSPNIVNSIR